MWSNSLDDLFHIAYADALETIKIEEDRQVLLAQRQKGRPGKMVGVDKVLHKKETEKLLKEKKYLKRKYEEELNIAEREETVELLVLQVQVMRILIAQLMKMITYLCLGLQKQVMSLVKPNVKSVCWMKNLVHHWTWQS